MISILCRLQDSSSHCFSLNAESIMEGDNMSQGDNAITIKIINQNFKKEFDFCSV